MNQFVIIPTDAPEPVLSSRARQIVFVLVMGNVKKLVSIKATPPYPIRSFTPDVSLETVMIGTPVTASTT